MAQFLNTEVWSDLDHRIVNRWQVVYRKAPIGEHPEQNGGNRDHHRHDRPTDEEFGKVHGLNSTCGFGKPGSH